MKRLSVGDTVYAVSLDHSPAKVISGRICELRAQNVRVKSILVWTFDHPVAVKLAGVPAKFSENHVFKTRKEADDFCAQVNSIKADVLIPRV